MRQGTGQARRAEQAVGDQRVLLCREETGHGQRAEAELVAGEHPGFLLPSTQPVGEVQGADVWAVDMDSAIPGIFPKELVVGSTP